MGESGPVCLSSSGPSGESDQQVIRSPMQKGDPGSPRLAQHAMVLGFGGSVIPDTNLSQENHPNLVTQPFNRDRHRDLASLNLHACLLEPRPSRSKGSLVQWQNELRLFKDPQPEQSMRRIFSRVVCNQPAYLIDVADVHLSVCLSVHLSVNIFFPDSNLKMLCPIGFNLYREIDHHHS